MNRISLINKEHLILIINFINDNSDEFNYFKNIGWNIKNIESHFSKNNNYSIPKNIDFILFNKSKINENNELEQMKFSFFEEFYNNYNNFSFKKNIIIEPIYISNNQLLN